MSSIERIIEREIQRWQLEQQRLQAERESRPDQPRRPWPWITISRELGSGGDEVAARLASLLGYRVYDREILEEIARISEFRQATLQALDEKVQSGITLYIEGVLHGRLHDRSDYLRHLIEAVVGIAHHGHAILLGRGAQFILEPAGGLRVRIVAPIEWRAASLVSRLGISEEEAILRARESDEQRRGFIKRFFGRDPDDSTGYDLSINTASLGASTAAHLIQVGLREKMDVKT